ncbi:hypothetical protein [Micromonospora chersina]|uniref:hypothetical protein n=1 Tax=Micromonospora chersina TaxID=47854 RepID=UPI003D92E598
MRRHGSQFGLSDEQWSAAKQELRTAVLEAAYERRMTCYSEVAAKVSAVHVDAYSALLNHLLGAILEDEQRGARPLLTAIVTHKSGDLEPGPGFYEMARSLGHTFDDPLSFWATQVQDVFKTHGRPERRRFTPSPARP